jgi:hypothetical protein
VGGVKARIWKDREDGLWHFAVRNSAGRLAWCGYRSTWEQALSLVLSGIDPERPWMTGT